ncbi:MAG: phenylalanine--tRNA ligase subunit alpha [Bdellovibrionota bacterium]
MQVLNTLLQDFTAELNTVQKVADLLNLKAKYIGKQGPLSDVMKNLKDATPEERKTIGAKANEVKTAIEELVGKKMLELEVQEINANLAKDKIDISLTDSVLEKGLQSAGYHPVTIIQKEIEDIFISMGFEVLDGPHIEDDYHNFEALNIPDTHPARDMQDTFWFADKKHLLRTHTSTIQVRGMKTRKPPFRFVGPGKVFRSERTDASHEMCFHQLEGMMVGEDVSVGNLIYFMKTLLTEIFKREVEVRLRPGFFPFVEPGFELDIKCLICGGKGCSVCKQVGWVELLPCGMVHPNVLRHGGIDPEKNSGFAFGLGLDRLVMMRYGIDDIRHLHGADLRFNSQFKSF